MQTSDQLAFRSIGGLAVDMMVTNKANIADVEIHDMGAFYILQIKAKILKNAEETTDKAVSEDQEKTSS